MLQLIVGIVLLVGALAIALGFIRLAGGGTRPRWLAVFLGAAAVGTLPVGGFIAYNFGSFFPGPGLCVAVLLIPVMLLSLIFMLSRRHAVRESMGDPSRYRLYVAGLVLIPLLQLAPLVEAAVFSRACNQANRGRARAIVAALEDYRAAQGDYPGELAALVPEYAAAVPAPACVAPFGWASSFGPRDDAFELQQCDDVTVLTVPAFADDSFSQRYNLATGTWRGKVSFLDGACSYLD